MQAIIVAGGRGERLRPITDHIPKPMVKVRGKPLLEHTIELFKANGIEEFILALCYLPEVIVDYFGDGRKFGVKIEYTYESPDKPLGDAGAITLARKIIRDTFLVTFADILRELNIKDMVGEHRRRGAFATLNVYRHYNDPKSMVIFDDQKRVSNFVERPGRSMLPEGYVWSNGSLFVLEPEIYDFIQTSQE